MAKLILASVLCIFLLVKGTNAAFIALGVPCEEGGATEATQCDNANDQFCQEKTCQTKLVLGDTCPADNSYCDPASLLCRDGTCKTKLVLGDTCPADNSYCDPASLLCRNGTCKTKLDAGGDCSDATTTVCDTGAATATITCEDGTCKIMADQSCSTVAGSPSCIANADCTGPVAISATCTCKDGYSESSDSTKCEANAGTGCSATTPCVSTANCEGGTCKANAGEVCNTNTPCVSTATCNVTCKVNLGESCTGGLTCVTGATCISDSLCKKEVTKAGEACPTLTTFCTSTTLTCDGGLCKVPAGQSCAATLATQCTAHADCPTTGDNPNICTCSTTDGFRSNAGVCEGTKDKDATCANDNCKPGLVCDGGKCKEAITEAGEDCSASVTDKACDTTTLACQNDKCKWKIEQVCTATDQCVTGAKCEGSLTTKQCNCPMGVQPSSDKAQCGGAMGIAASMLLVVATFVTSRFL